MSVTVPLLSNRCTAGVTACGKSPAKPYPCGPRCDDHKPAPLPRPIRSTESDGATR